MKLNNKKGISLIVLVITIVVMIILAVAIILSLQSSGIIGRANEASTKSDEANMLQAANVAYGDYLLEKNLGQTNVEAEAYVKEKLEGNFDEEKLKKLSILSDGTVQILPTIPTGFVVSQIEGENRISEGLVVYEIPAGITVDWTATSEGNAAILDVQEKYNQYVWVPVYEEFQRVSWNGEDLENKYTEPYEDGYETEIAEYNKMKASVEKNGGFYIARYEAGKEDNSTVVSKKAADVWNNIVWGVDMTTIGENGAVYLSRNLYQENDNNFVSTLCYGVQWDAVMNFMKDVTNPNVAGDKKYIEDSTGMGVYRTGAPTLTGSNELYKVKNIYDMAGNVYECTMEADSTNSRVVRGGCCANNGSDIPVSLRSNGFPFTAFDVVGFRVALYLK